MKHPYCVFEGTCNSSQVRLRQIQRNINHQPQQFQWRWQRQHQAGGCSTANGLEVGRKVTLARVVRAFLLLLRPADLLTGAAKIWAPLKELTRALQVAGPKKGTRREPACKVISSARCCEDLVTEVENEQDSSRDLSNEHQHIPEQRLPKAASRLGWSVQCKGQRCS